MKRLIAALMALGSAAAVCAAPPPRVELSFTIMMGSLRIGEGREVLEHDGRLYRIVSESKPRGVASLFINDVRRESRGSIGSAGLRPDLFEESGRRGGARSARFDWSGGQLVLTDGEASRTVALPRGTQDQASLAYAFSFRPKTGENIEIHVTDGRGVRPYRYRELAPETLVTPLGEIRTRHFEKVRGPEDKRGFEFWLAPERYYLPVKLRYVEKNGDTFDSIITEIRAQ